MRTIMVLNAKGGCVQRQLVPGNVAGIQSNSGLNIGLSAFNRLSWQTVHQINIEVCEATCAHIFNRPHNVSAAVDSTQRLQMLIIETLRAN